MAKPKFDPNVYKTQKEQSGGDFPDVEPGIYICTLEKCYCQGSKGSGRLQVSFGYQIDPGDPNFKNQYVWSHIGIANQDGSANEQGYKILGIVMSALKIKYDPASDDFDKVLEGAVGTKVRLQLSKSNPNPDGICYDQIRIKQVLSTPQAPTPDAKTNQRPDVDDLDAASNGPASEPIEINPGDWIICQDDKLYKIIGLLDVNESEDGNQYMQVLPQGGKLPRDMVTKNCDEFKSKATPPKEEAPAPAQKRELDEVEELEEEEEAAPIKLAVGVKAKGTSSVSGKSVSGEVKEIVEDIVKISDGKTIFRCKKDTVEVL